MLTCKDASQLISQRLERPLGFREWLGLRLHLLICLYCRRFERQVALMHQALRELGRRIEAGEPGIAEDVELSPEARERIRKALAECGAHGH